MPTITGHAERVSRSSIVTGAPIWPQSVDEGTHMMASPQRTSIGSYTRTSSVGEGSSLLPTTETADGEKPLGEVGFGATTFNSVNTMLGSGCLSLPYAYRISGWLFCSIVMVLLLFVTLHTGKILRKCLDYYPGIRSFPDIGEVAFGVKGRYFISVMFYFELFTASVMYVILAADNLLVLLPAWEKWQLIVITCLIVLPTASTSKLGILSYFSLVGITASLVLTLVVLEFGFTTTEAPGSVWDPMPTSIMPPDYDKSFAVFGLVMVGFAGHACLPSIYESMSTPQDYDRMLNITWIVLSTVYLSVAVVGYLMYGNDTEDMITKNLEKGWAATMTVVLIVINPMTKFGLTINPIALASEELTEERLSPGPRFIFDMLVRWGLTGLVAITSIVVPNFATVIGLIGSVFSFSVSVLFPVAAYLSLYGDELSSTEILVNRVIFGTSAIMAILGTYGTLCLA
ncbi:hypothetical protein SARC_11837 [Sphaeroforma arctica JP610]|uniref:Amino acid transporter transmembrane domain-containing protein n=1 Tax=Sphaeroforma arctica JP610 TaxID=667725 RepID=A0A0L0FGR4_9EUKA|nr:hypothetical protein SARC_11837 [Sphaeroforma arctica JP610]KNC75641.1 hypothetical protein SARC_11837 [Sphaeroforma arctica JP610]|eukprot:XP_014149543.1 hypothetical protein SARC_11837 [Sphaeroforma arctica JP610]